MKNIEVVRNICTECVSEGEALINTKFNSDNGITSMAYVDLEGFHRWKSNCNVLIGMLGELSNPWSEVFDGEKANTLVNTLAMIGGLKSINDTLDKGYLLRIEDLIFAEAFSNLIDQSEYLFKQNYFLAAGIIGRAVLEEKLRNVCERKGIEFIKPKPTLSDFNMQLYKDRFYDKIEHKNIDYLISIGNNAAHNQAVSKEDISSLIEGIKKILIKYN
jgi:hypothetical protein